MRLLDDAQALMREEYAKNRAERSLWAPVLQRVLRAQYEPELALSLQQRSTVGAYVKQHDFQNAYGNNFVEPLAPSEKQGLEFDRCRVMVLKMLMSTSHQMEVTNTADEAGVGMVLLQTTQELVHAVFGKHLTMATVAAHATDTLPHIIHIAYLIGWSLGLWERPVIYANASDDDDPKQTQQRQQDGLRRTNTDMLVRFVVLRGSYYGMGVVPQSQAMHLGMQLPVDSIGTHPYVEDFDNNEEHEDLKDQERKTLEQLHEALDGRRRGTTVVIIELVSAAVGGKRVTRRLLKQILHTCNSRGAYLAADETLTAIRCGSSLLSAAIDDGFRPHFTLVGKIWDAAMLLTDEQSLLDIQLVDKPESLASYSSSTTAAAAAATSSSSSSAADISDSRECQMEDAIKQTFDHIDIMWSTHGCAALFMHFINQAMRLLQEHATERCAQEGPAMLVALRSSVGCTTSETQNRVHGYGKCLWMHEDAERQRLPISMSACGRLLPRLDQNADQIQSAHAEARADAPEFTKLTQFGASVRQLVGLYNCAACGHQIKQPDGTYECSACPRSYDGECADTHRFQCGCGGKDTLSKFVEPPTETDEVIHARLPEELREVLPFCGVQDD